jgi:AraC-like DNA-binding protein
MQYQEHYIEPSLRPFIKVIWSMENDTVTFGGTPMRILPDTCVELVIHYSDPFLTTFSNDTTSIQGHSFIVAQMKNFMEIQPNGKVGLIAVRFTAWGAYHFFGIPMKEVANGETALQFVWNTLAGEIEDRIASASANNQRIQIIQQYLLFQLAKNGKFDHAVDFCLNEISLAKGQLTIEELSYKTGISNRQLVRRFNNCIGLSPKEFARITKFLHSLDYLRQFPQKSLTEVGYECGYYDQAHFIRDFKEYSGLTPGEYLVTDNVVY